METSVPLVIQHTNSLSTYLSDWRMMVELQNQARTKQYKAVRIPPVFRALPDLEHDLCTALSFLDTRLVHLEGYNFSDDPQFQQFPHQPYSEARFFLKTSYFYFRILLDGVAGVIKFFYDQNEPNTGLSKSFNDLTKQKKIDTLSDQLQAILRPTQSWFPESRRRRVEFEHNYESLLITFERGSTGNILGHSGLTGLKPEQFGHIKGYFGTLLAGYQELIDNLLDHLDHKFLDWYKLVLSPNSRTGSILQGNSAMMLYWAYQYGGYRHANLQVQLPTEVTG